MFTSTSGPFASDGDSLAIYTASQTGFSQAPSARYIFVENTGWIDTANVFGGAVNITIPAGSVATVRKQGATEQETLFHSVNLPYNPFAE